IDAVDAKTIYRLLWLNNAIIVRNKFTSFVVFPIDIKNRLGLLVFFSEQMRDEISQAGTYDQESEILSKIKKIVSLISAICQSKNNLNENFLVYWVSSSIGENVKRVAEVKDKDLSDNNEKVFFAYQEKISRSLKIFDQKQAIKYFNKLQYLAPIDDYPYRHDREKKERYLRRLLISFTSSLSDHLIDSNVSIDDVTKLRMKVINDLMITRLSGNFYKEMNNIIWKFFALFKQSSMLHDSDMALKCKNYIDDHLNDGVSLKDVYKNLHYFNKKKLSHDFNRRFGTTVKHY
ncbi:hypothetical protein, partial [Oenococcus oeni]|uniref:hypothetical protein n=1 Tax=Oenococcus oeni TaxID=1247 RepID=UPI0016455F09